MPAPISGSESKSPADLPAGPSASHEFLEHVSELKLRVRAATFDELLSEAGTALGTLLARGAPLRLDPLPRDIVVSSSDREALLVDWLNELVFLAETEHWVPVTFDRVEARDTQVRATVRGVPVTEAPALVKAATHHGLRVEQLNGMLQAEVILDI